MAEFCTAIKGLPIFIRKALPLTIITIFGYIFAIYILNNYNDVSRIYLEVETFGANRKASFAIFDALATLNDKLDTKIDFGANLALTSNFMKNDIGALPNGLRDWLKRNDISKSYEMERNQRIKLKKMKNLFINF